MRSFYFAPLALAAIGFTRAQTTHIIDVGDLNGDTIYTPNQVNATKGDIIQFRFHQKNHTATQSSLDNPCTPLTGGFDTGFQPVAPGVTDDLPTAQITVQDENPIWFYCRQKGHCAAGMAGAINPGDKFAQFLAAAKATANSTTTQAPPPPPPPPPPPASSAPPPSSTDSSTSSTASAPPSASTPTVHRIIAGENGTLTYNPSNITAAVGDTVVIEFRAKNHTFTQSTFGDPCKAISFTNPGVIGIDSGFMPVAPDATEFPTINFTVNDTNPLWGYCRQTNPVPHCGSGMAFAINAPLTGNKTFADFVALAKQLNGTNATSSSGGNSSSSGGSTGDKSAASSDIIIPRGLISVFALLMLGLCL